MLNHVTPLTNATISFKIKNLSQVSKRRHVDVDNGDEIYKLNMKVHHFPSRQLTEISTPTQKKAKQKKSENKLKRDEQKLIQGCEDFTSIQILLAFNE